MSKSTNSLYSGSSSIVMPKTAASSESEPFAGPLHQNSAAAISFFFLPQLMNQNKPL